MAWALMALAACRDQKVSSGCDRSRDSKGREKDRCWPCWLWRTTDGLSAHLSGADMGRRGALLSMMHHGLQLERLGLRLLLLPGRC